MAASSPWAWRFSRRLPRGLRRAAEGPARPLADPRRHRRLLFADGAAARAFVVPWPEGRAWIILAGAMAIHVGYKLCQAMAYSLGAFTVVYPVVRGTGPLVTVMAAGVVFGEHYTGTQWIGVLMLSGGILALSAVNVAAGALGRARLRTRSPGPWSPVFSLRPTRLRRLWHPGDARSFHLSRLVLPGRRADLPLDRARPLPADARSARPRTAAAAGLVGGLVAYLSFGSVMLATRIDKVGQAAVLRETSVVFAALIGWAFLGERVGRCGPVS